MRLVQEEKFSPIALVFETRDEAEMFWDVIRSVDTGCGEPNSKKKFKLFQRISDLFSNEAKL